MNNLCRRGSGNRVQITAARRQTQHILEKWITIIVRYSTQHIVSSSALPFQISLVWSCEKQLPDDYTKAFLISRVRVLRNASDLVPT